MHTLDMRVTTVSPGLFGAVTFTLCVLYGLLVPPAFHGAPDLAQLDGAPVPAAGLGSPTAGNTG